MQALNTHVRAHIQTQMQARTHTHTYIYQTHICQGCTNTPLDMGHRHTQTFADSYVYTDTPVCACSLGHALVGAGPCLPTHSSTACRPHCRAEPPPFPFVSLWIVVSRLDWSQEVGAGQVEASHGDGTRLGRGWMTLDAWGGRALPCPRMRR